MNLEPLRLSLLVALSATLVSLPPALLVAWVLERTRWRGRAALQAVVFLPLVLPPVVTGYLLLRVLSPRSVLGGWLDSMGLPVAFHFAGAVVAAAVVGFPLFVMLTARAFQAVDPRLETVSRSLGRGRFATFRLVTLPLAWPGIAAGAALAFARGLGEFGATIVLAGHVPGETETIPLAVHAALARPGGEAQALGLCGLSLLLAVSAVLTYRWGQGRHERRLELDR